MPIPYVSFDGQFRASPRTGEALAMNQTASLSTLLSGLPSLLSTLSSDISGWSGNPTTSQIALAVSDARAIETILERAHAVVHTNRKG